MNKTGIQALVTIIVILLENEWLMYVLIIEFMLQSHVVAVPDEVIPLVHINASILVSNNLLCMAFLKHRACSIIQKLTSYRKCLTFSPFSIFF